MEVLGVDETALQEQVVTALIGSFVVFFVIAPIGGRFLHRWIAQRLPEHSMVVLAGLAGIIFLLSFAIVLGILLRWGSIGIETSLLVSLLIGLLAVVIMALAVRITIQRTTTPTPLSGETPDVRSGAWGVWGEDAKTRSKNLRQRKR